MEDLINPYWSDILEEKYYFFTDQRFLSCQGIEFVEEENKHFDLEGKVNSLNKKIDEILECINKSTFDNKNEYIKAINIKKDDLQKLLLKYEDIKQSFVQSDKLYRIDLFQFYNSKYDNTALFSFSERRKYLDIMNEIQHLLYNKFVEFYTEYYNIRNSFFVINSYMIKIKKLFNFNF